MTSTATTSPPILRCDAVVVHRQSQSNAAKRVCAQLRLSVRFAALLCMPQTPLHASAGERSTHRPVPPNRQDYPEGQDSIVFEPCSVIGTSNCRGLELGIIKECTACSGAGGVLNKDIAIRIDYAQGPLGDKDAKGNLYLGLYQVDAAPCSQQPTGCLLGSAAH